MIGMTRIRDERTFGGKGTLSVQWISRFSPAFYLEQLALTSVGLPHYSTVALDIAALGGLTLLCAFFAVRRLARFS